MEKKGRVKRQHFVPRCLLRRFSKNAQTTSVFVIGTAKFVHIAPIKAQCAADYYYGHEQTIETKLGELEGAFSSAIGDLSNERLDRLGQDELAFVRAFVHVQAERTPAAVSVQRATYEDMGRQLYSAYAKLNKLPAEDGPAYAEKFACRQMPTPGAHVVELAVKYSAAVADLEVKFVRAEGLMISDHPTLTLNLWRDNHERFAKWPVLGGLATKGFMYLMPVATDCLVLLYDKATYEVGEDSSRIASATGSDTIVVNALQTINASQLLFDNTAVGPGDLAGALNVRNRTRAQYGAGVLQLRPAGIPLSFVRVLDHDSHQDWNLAMLPSRSSAQNLPGELPDQRRS